MARNRSWKVGSNTNPKGPNWLKDLLRRCFGVVLGVKYHLRRCLDPRVSGFGSERGWGSRDLYTYWFLSRAKRVLLRNPIDLGQRQGQNKSKNIAMNLIV